MAQKIIDWNVNCDSDFMLGVMDEVGRAIRTKFHWVPFTVEIDFFLDNAGGHGTDEAKAEYVDMLKERYNIRVVWQIPQSPETNMLDLGLWCSLQSKVELTHRTKTKANQDALARSCMEAWNSLEVSKLSAVAKRWTKVLNIICHSRGDNVKSDAFRGKSIVPEVDIDTLEAELSGVTNRDEEQQAEEETALDD